ncbi:uncharacterized protein LOC144594712 [Rhinoraja longicauda]
MFYKVELARKTITQRPCSLSHNSERGGDSKTLKDGAQNSKQPQGIPRQEHQANKLSEEVRPCWRTGVGTFDLLHYPESHHCSRWRFLVLDTPRIWLLVLHLLAWMGKTESSYPIVGRLGSFGPQASL